jgi:hypothetical protein
MIIDRPPPGWKRPGIPVSVKCDVLIRQGGKSATGAPLESYTETHFDHRPALWERLFDDETGDTIPPANDPKHIEAITRDEHDKRTHGPGGEKRITTAGSDSGRRSKEVRLGIARAALAAALSRACGEKRKKTGTIKGNAKWPTRKFRS